MIDPLARLERVRLGIHATHAPAGLSFDDFQNGPCSFESCTELRGVAATLDPAQGGAGLRQQFVATMLLAQPDALGLTADDANRLAAWLVTHRGLPPGWDLRGPEGTG